MVAKDSSSCFPKNSRWAAGMPPSAYQICNFSTFVRAIGYSRYITAIYLNRRCIALADYCFQHMSENVLMIGRLPSVKRNVQSTQLPDLGFQCYNAQGEPTISLQVRTDLVHDPAVAIFVHKNTARLPIAPRIQLVC